MPYSSPQKRFPNRVQVFASSPIIRDGIGRLSDGYGLPLPSIRDGDIVTALTEPENDVEVLLVEVSDSATGLEAMSNLALQTNAQVIAIGPENDIRTLHQYCKAGAADYLAFPFDDEDLLETLKVPVSNEPSTDDGSEKEVPKVTCFIGCRGGVGTSTLAVSTAWWLAEVFKSQTALVDMDLNFGTAALSLDIMPSRGFREALESPERIDPLFIGSAMINASENLFVLAAEENPGTDIYATPGSASKLIEALEESFPSIIIDLPRANVSSSRDLIARADNLILVTELSLAGLRDAIRLRDLVKDIAPAASLSLITAETRQGGSALSRKEFERGLEGVIDWQVPYLPKQIAQAANDGRALADFVGRRHAYSKLILDIATMIKPAQEKEGKQGLRKWLW